MKEAGGAITNIEMEINYPIGKMVANEGYLVVEIDWDKDKSICLETKKILEANVIYSL